MDSSKKMKKLQIITKEDLDVDVMAEVELSRLQRQYRIMEGDRAAYVEETNIKLAKQRKVIDALRKEHSCLAADYRVASSATNKTKDERHTRSINKLLKTHMVYCERIGQEKANLKEIDHQIRKIEKQVMALRPREITDQQCSVRIKSGKQTIEKLENVLNNHVKRFCATLAENRKIRQEIDHLLKEREQFNQAYTKKLQALDHGKKILLELVERAIMTYDQREEWCNKLSALHTRIHNDTILHNREMRELQRRLDYDSCLHEFLEVKGQKRVMRDLERKQQKIKELEKQKAEKQLMVYAETLEQIKQLSGERNEQRLAALYLKQEEENFALFNYVNELNAELEELGNAILQLKSDIDEQKRQNEVRAKQQQKTVACLTGELELAIRETKVARVALRNKQAEMADFLRDINELFVLLRCNEAPALGLLGSEAKISDNNVFVYLELIEKRVEDILQKKITNL